MKETMRTLVFVVVMLALCAGMALGQTQQTPPVFQPAQILTAPKALSVEELVASAGGDARPMAASAVLDSADQRLIFMPLINGQVLQRGETLTVNLVPIGSYTGDAILYGWWTPSTTWLSSGSVPVRAPTARDAVLRGGLRGGEMIPFHQLTISEALPFGRHQLEMSVVEPGIGSQRTLVNFCVLYCELGHYYIRQAAVVAGPYGGRVIKLEGRFPAGTTFPVMLSNIPAGGVTSTVYFVNPFPGEMALAIPPEMQWNGGIATSISVSALFPDGTASGIRVLFDSTLP